MELGLAEEASSPEDTQSLRSYAELMTHELERCGRIVSGLLSFSRESRMEYTCLDLNEVLSSVVTLTRHKMELQEIEVALNLSQVPLTVRGDMHRLQQCFLNLIFNAIEAMPSGGMLELQTYPDQTQQKAMIVVRDTGYGIAEDRLGHIFDPFFTTKEMGSGTGLGLSIVYGVVKNHEGNIEVHSKVGRGTVFIIALPLARP
jgi:signal transduction histidine kinase